MEKLKRKNFNSGITLIALVITIIVLLILAGISIATLTGENGILTKANTAKEEHLISQYKEEINLIIAEEIAERKTEVKEELMIESLDKKIKKKDWVAKTNRENVEGASEEYLIVESKEGYEFIIEVNKEKETAKIIQESKISEGKYTITYVPNGGVGEAKTIEVRRGFDTMLEKNTFTREGYIFKGWYEKQELEEEAKPYLEGEKYQPKGNSILYAIWEAEPVEIGKIVKVTKKDNYTDKDGDKATIPAGFAIVPEGSDISEGLIISDVANDTLNTGNQFVWVPVPDINDFKTVPGYYRQALQTVPEFNGIEAFTAEYKEPDENGYQNEVEEYNAMKTSVSNYHGFYMARYEAGKEKDGSVIIKKGATSYVYVPWGNSMTDIEGTSNIEGKEGAVKLAKNFATSKGYKDVISTLCYGVQWDAALKFIDPAYTGYAKYGTKSGWYYDNYNATTSGNIRNQSRA